MSFQLQHIEGDKWELVFSDEPDYIHALNMAPEAMESELHSGVWLVVAFPVWSGPVRDSVRAALSFAKDHGGTFQLGLRPFYSHEEVHNWWPGKKAPSGGEVSMAVRNEPSGLEIHLSTDSSCNPLWLVLQNGRVLYQGMGPRSKEQLSQLMQPALI